MGSAKFGSFLFILGFIGLLASCGAMQQLDHDNPVKPHKKYDTQLVHRIMHTNKQWYPMEKPVIEIATD